MYLRDIVRSVLTEEANIEGVTDAIKKRYEVEIDYDSNDGNPKGKGKRLIQPVALGHSKAGNLVVRAFEPYGDTETSVPHWKFFRLDRIKNWKGYKKRRFTEPPVDNMRDSLGHYNPNGDGSMVDVLVNADFRGSNAYMKGEGKYKGLKAHNVQRQKEKQERDGLQHLQNNIKNAVNMGDVDYVRRNIDAWDKASKQQDFDKMEKWKKEHSNEPKYQNSLANMKQVTNFGDEDNVQTVGPVTKDNYDTNEVPQNNNVNYGQVAKNGPVYQNNNNSNVDSQQVNGNEEERPEWEDEYEQFLKQYNLDNDEQQ